MKGFLPCHWRRGFVRALMKTSCWAASGHLQNHASPEAQSSVGRLQHPQARQSEACACNGVSLAGALQRMSTARSSLALTMSMLQVAVVLGRLGRGRLAQDPSRNVKAVPAGEERQNAIADAIVRNAGAKLEKMPADKVRGLRFGSAEENALVWCCVHHLSW